jgi:hypothetical protein
MTTFYFDDTQPFHPAQTFTDDTAYFGVRLEADVRIDRGPSKGESRRLPVLAFVTSDAEVVAANHEILLARGLRYAGLTFPEPPDARWRPSQIEAYLAGKVPAPDAASLYESVRDAFRSRVEFPIPGYADVCALFTLGTYVHRLFDAFPYIELHGSKEAGKTKTANIIKSLAFNAVDATALTGGALYLEVEAHGATLLLDDAENLGDEEQRAVMAMLNVGYKCDAATIRGNWDTKSARRFGVYSPKVITTIKGVGDTLATRCIRIPMQPSLDPTIRDQSEEPGSPRWPVLRSDLYVWALTAWQAVRESYRTITRDEVGFEGLSGRAWELWRPLVALARYLDAAGAHRLVDDVREVAAATQRRARLEQGDTREGAVLRFLLAAYGAEVEVVEFAPAELSEQLEEDGEKVSARSLGWILKRVGLGDYQNRTGKKRRYQIPREALVRAAARRGVDDASPSVWVPPANVSNVSNDRTSPQKSLGPAPGASQSCRSDVSDEPDVFTPPAESRNGHRQAQPWSFPKDRRGACCICGNESRSIDPGGRWRHPTCVAEEVAS